MKHEKCVACNGSGYYDMVGSPRCGCCQGLGYVKTDKWIELEQTELKELKRLAAIGKALEDGTIGNEIRHVYMADPKFFEELERLSSVGKAIERAFGFSENDDYIGQISKSHNGNFIVTNEVWGSVEELIEWAESEGIDEQPNSNR